MISLTRVKSAMSASRSVTLTTSSSPPPAACATARRFSNTCRDCASVPSRRLPVAGSSPIWPERYTVLPARIACEYGPIAAGAASVWIACLLTAMASWLLATTVPCSVLDFVTGLDPRVDPAQQRPDALVADLPQPLRDLDRGCLVRAGAIEDHLAVSRNVLECSVDLVHVDGQCAGDPAGGRLCERGTHVDQRLHFLLGEHLLQLVDRHAIHPELLDEEVAAAPLDHDPDQESGDDQHHAVFPEG